MKTLQNAVLDGHNLLPVTARAILRGAAATRNPDERVLEVDRAINVVQTKWPQYFRVDAKPNHDLFQQQ